MNSAYDIYLGDKSNLQGYRLRSLVRDSAPLIASKFSSGEQGQSDLDLLKVKTWKSCKGGMFQRDWVDDEKGARVRGFYNMYDENLYPIPAWSTLSSPATYLGSSHSVTAKCTAYNSTYVAHREGATNKLHKIAANGTVTNIVLPAAISGSTIPITDLSFHKGYVFICGSNASGFFNNHRYNVSAGTFQDITGAVRLWSVLRGVLYGISITTNVFSTTNEEAAGAATYNLVKTVGHSDTTNNLPSAFVEFNGAIWAATPQALFRFDGMDSVTILKQNVSYLTAYNGSLYYVLDGWLYRFDGTSIERLQYFGTSELVVGMSVTGDYLTILCQISTQGKYAGSDSDGTIDYRVYSWDGVGFQLIFEEDTVQAIGDITSVGTLMLLSTVANGLFSYGYMYVDFSKRFIPTTTGGGVWSLEATTSQFDAGFPNVFKSLEFIEVDFNDLHANDTLTIAYQYFNGLDWSAWITLGTMSTTNNRIEVVETGSIVKLAKAFKVRAFWNTPIGTSSSFSLKDISLYYTLQPRPRWRWQLGINAGGVDPLMGLKDRNGTKITNDANELTNLITKSIKSKTPVFMLAPDYGIIKTTVNSAATSFIVKGQIPLYTDPYNEYPLCAVKNASGVWELFRVATISYASGPDETTVTVKERGYQGITAASLNANAEFHLAYKVYVTKLLRDATILDDNTYNEQSTGESQLKRIFDLEITEV